MTNERIISRDELYQAVWSRTMRDLANEFGISDVGLRKICIKLDIPLPGAGHWRKVEVGKVIKPPPLPLLKPGGLNEYKFSNHERGQKTEFTDDENKALKRIEQASKHIVVKKKLVNLHPLVNQIASELNSGFVAFGHLVTSNNTPHSIRVSKKQLKRALKILDSLIHTLEVQGFTVIKEDKLFLVEINNEKLKIVLKEKVNRIKKNDKNPWGFDKYDYIPAGHLTLCIEDVYTDRPIRRNFPDTPKKKVEDQIGLFIGALIIAAHAYKEHNQALKEWSHKIDKEDSAREEAERLIELETLQADDLFETVKLYNRVKSIREFIDMYKTSIYKIDCSQDEMEKAEEWIKWAEKYADKIDPLKQMKALLK